MNSFQELMAKFSQFQHGKTSIPKTLFVEQLIKIMDNYYKLSPEDEKAIETIAKKF